MRSWDVCTRAGTLNISALRTEGWRTRRSRSHEEKANIINAEHQGQSDNILRVTDITKDAGVTASPSSWQAFTSLCLYNIPNVLFVFHVLWRSSELSFYFVFFFLSFLASFGNSAALFWENKKRREKQLRTSTKKWETREDLLYRGYENYAKGVVTDCSSNSLEGQRQTKAVKYWNTGGLKIKLQCALMLDMNFDVVYFLE